ncbi:Tachykinin-like peptide receptor 86C [Orchesella cincta]|uniref:Tachykinin-like peptide receptor 86C n=1 Tax=Orchesella cincta TaxID=48709 RepID=A0A1D2NAZ9_ORCCI|nr:Tachykinin-like peptide receptor 86C [Orchesella cincta]
MLAHRRMRTVTNYFLLNLSVADLTMAILNGAPNFFYMLRNDWIFGEILCVVNNFVANFTVASCVFTMMAISIDRWIAVMRPLEPRMKKRSAWKAIAAIWLGSAVLAAPALVYSKTILYSTGARSCMVIWPDGKTPDESVYDLAYNVVLLVVTYVIPMTAMAICYGTMSWELWGHTHIGEVTERQRNSMISKRKVEKMVVRMFIIVVLSFAICWLPYHGYFIYMYYDKTLAYKNWAQPLYLSFYFLAMSTSMINPVVYYFMNSRFRNYIQETMKNFCCCRRRQSDLSRRFLQETPPLLRHCHNYSQSCSRSRSGEVFRL